MNNNLLKRNLIILMLFSPALGVIALLKNKNEKLITFFGTFFMGIIGSVYVYNEGSDGYTHLMIAKNEYLNLSFFNFLKQSFSLVTFEQVGTAKDIYLHTISYISAAIFQIPELIHVFSGFVLGYFFTKSVLLVLRNNLNVKKSALLLAFIALFLMIKSIGALNSIRMWTGMWVFFYGTFSYATTKNKKYIFVILFSVVVHFSYVIFIIPALLAYIARNQKLLLIGVYLASFVFSLSFSRIANFLPKTSLVENQQNSNVIDSDERAAQFDERYEAQESKSKNFYVRFGPGFYNDFSIVGLSFLLLSFFWNKKADSNLVFLLALGIGLYTFANLVAFSPSLQGRTKNIAALFILAAAIRGLLSIKQYAFSNRKMNWLNNGFRLFLVSSVPMFFFQISYLLQNFSFFLVLFPQISWILGDDDYSIRAALGLIID